MSTIKKLLFKSEVEQSKCNKKLLFEKYSVRTQSGYWHSKILQNLISALRMKIIKFSFNGQQI